MSKEKGDRLTRKIRKVITEKCPELVADSYTPLSVSGQDFERIVDGFLIALSVPI